MLRYILRAAILPACAAPSPGGQVHADTSVVIRGELGDRLDDYMRRLESLGYSGGLLVVSSGETMIRKGYGLADRKRGIRVTPATVFDMGSITKQFTAAAILKLESQGKLRVEDPVTRWFPDAPADKHGITLHHLLTHTSGLEPNIGESEYNPTGREEYVRQVLASRLQSAPGERFSYANTGYSLLAAVVEMVTGQDYESALHALVLEPAGMRETGYRAPGWSPERIAHGYRDGGDWGTTLERHSAPGGPFWTLRGNGGLHTTLADMARWDAALRGDAVLPAEARQKFFRPYVHEGPDAPAHYAYGWSVSRTARRTTRVGHNGSNRVYVAELHRFVDEGVTVFVTSTVAELPATAVGEAVERIVFGGDYALPPRAARVDAATLARYVGRYVGRYRFPAGSELVVEWGGDALEVSAEGQAAYALLAGGDTTGEAMLAELGARSERLAAAAARGDYAPLHEALGGAVPIERLAETESRDMRMHEQQYGKFQRVRLLGTVREPQTAVTTVRLDFERGSVINRYTWGARRLVGIHTGQLPPPPRLVPLSDTELVTFSMAGPGGVRFRFAPDGSSVEVGGATARRVP